MIADSAEVEVLLIEKEHMHLFPEEAQRMLNTRLAEAFDPERPYSDETVEAIKAKFKEWDHFKIYRFLSQLKIMFNARQLH